MASQFYTILTTIGQQKMAAAIAGGAPIALHELAVGSGVADAYYSPLESQNTLQTEVWRGLLNSLETDPTNPNYCIAEAVIPTNVGGFTIREVGIFDTAGDLIAIGKFPETYKPVTTSGTSKELVIRFIFEVANASVVNLTVDPSFIMASVAYVNKMSRRMGHFFGRR